MYTNWLLQIKKGLPLKSVGGVLISREDPTCQLLLI